MTGCVVQLFFAAFSLWLVGKNQKYTIFSRVWQSSNSRSRGQLFSKFPRLAVQRRMHDNKGILCVCYDYIIWWHFDTRFWTSDIFACSKSLTSQPPRATFLNHPVNHRKKLSASVRQWTSEQEHCPSTIASKLLEVIPPFPAQSVLQLDDEYLSLSSDTRNFQSNGCFAFT